jgi:protein gp37
MADLFHEGRPDEIIDRVCATLAVSDHIGLLLTKRTARMAEYLLSLDLRTVSRWQPKLWLGFSAERQQEFDQRWADMQLLAKCRLVYLRIGRTHACAGEVARRFPCNTGPRVGHRRW